MSSETLLHLPPRLYIEKKEREKRLVLVRENKALACPIFLSGSVTRIAFNPGYSHLQIPKRHFILENRNPIADIAELFSDSEIICGHSEEDIDAYVSIGSGLSNQLARILDGHAETLERVRKPVFGSLLTEFDPSRNIVSYIEGQRVTEPFRVIINEGNRKQAPIFEPKPVNAIPEEDALVIKVLRSRSGAAAIIRIEGLGPAGTVHGFRLLLENRSILLELSKCAAKRDSFEVMIIVKGVGVEDDIRERKSMTAKGPLYIEKFEPIPAPEQSFDVITAAVNSGMLNTKHKNSVVNMLNYRKLALALDGQGNYNPDDKNTGALVVPPGKDSLIERETGKLKIEEIISDESKKTIDKFKEQVSASGLSDEEGIEIFKQGMSGARGIFDARFVEGVTSEEMSQKIRGLAKKEGVVFESKPKPREPLTPPDLSEIPLWQGRKKDGMPLEFIRTNYGKWLSAFGAEQDIVFQDQIRSHDRKLMQGVRSQLHEEGKSRKKGERIVSDFVKSRSARVDRELENISIEDIKKNPRLATTLYWRGRRAAERRKRVVSQPVTTEKKT